MQAELETTKCVSQNKDQQLSVLEEEQQVKLKEMASLTFKCQQQQRELQLLKEGKSTGLLLLMQQIV